MTKTGQEDPRFKNLEKKVGIFISIVLVMLLALFFFMGKERGIFTKKYTLFLTVDSASGFIEGIPVKLLGFKIGKVKALSLTSEAKVRVALEINKEYQKWIKKGSVARMLKEGLIGDTVVEISAGPSSGKIIEEGEDLGFEKVGGIEELVKEINPVLHKVQEIITYIDNPEGDVKKAFANFGRLSEDLLKTKDDLDGALKDAKGTFRDASSAFARIDNISDKTAPVIDKAALLMDKAIAIASDAEKASNRLPGIIDKTDKVMNDVKRFSDVLSKKSHEIKNMIEDTGDMLRDTKEIVNGAKDSWPINSMLPPKKELKLIPLDSSGGPDR